MTNHTERWVEKVVHIKLRPGSVHNPPERSQARLSV